VRERGTRGRRNLLGGNREKEADKTEGNGRGKPTKPQIKWERPINEGDL
jgi:hypothetical protein